MDITLNVLLVGADHPNAVGPDEAETVEGELSEDQVPLGDVATALSLGCLTGP